MNLFFNFLFLSIRSDDCCGADATILKYVRGCTFDQVCQSAGGRCRPVMVTSTNIPYLAKKLRECKIDNAGVGGWNGERLPMVLQASGELNQYDPITNPTCHVLCEGYAGGECKMPVRCYTPKQEVLPVRCYTPKQEVLCKPMQAYCNERNYQPSKEYCHEKKSSTICGFIENLLEEGGCESLTMIALLLLLFKCNNEQPEPEGQGNGRYGSTEKAVLKSIYLLNSLKNSFIISKASTSNEHDQQLNEEIEEST